jgi:hypothetical protein
MVKLGRIFFAIPLGVFGIQYLVYGQWRGGLPPVPPWTPGGHIFAYVTGVVLLALSVSLLGKKEACAFEAFALAGAAFVLANLVASLRKALRFKFSPQPIPFLP